MICSEIRRIFVIFKNGKTGSINNLKSVSTNKHIGSKMYEPSKVSVRRGTHLFIHLIPKDVTEGRTKIWIKNSKPEKRVKGEAMAVCFSIYIPRYFVGLSEFSIRGK